MAELTPIERYMENPAETIDKNFKSLQKDAKVKSEIITEMVTHLDGNTVIDYNPNNRDVTDILLMFSGYATTARDYNHTVRRVPPPKISKIGEWSMQKLWFGNVEKTFYVSNTQIRGHEANAAGGPSDAIVLRRVGIEYNG